MRQGAIETRGREIAPCTPSPIVTRLRLLLLLLLLLLTVQVHVSHRPSHQIQRHIHNVDKNHASMLVLVLALQMDPE